MEEKTVLLLEHDGLYALRRRGDTGLLAGMWEFPNLDGFLGPDELLSRLQDLSPQGLIPCGEARHLFTHVEWRMRGYRVPCAVMSPAYTWLTPNALRAHHAIPSAFRFFLNQL